MIKGSEQITTWEKVEGNVWRVVLNSRKCSETTIPMYRCTEKDTFDYFPVYNCGDVYLNEEAYYQKASVEDLNGNSKPGTLRWIRRQEPPQSMRTLGAQIPMKSWRRSMCGSSALRPQSGDLPTSQSMGLKYSTPRICILISQGYPEHCQSGAISTNGGLKWIIENNTVINARSIAIDIGLRCDLWAGNRDARDPGKYPEDAKYFTSYKDTEKYGQHIVRNNLIQKRAVSAGLQAYSPGSHRFWTM